MRAYLAGFGYIEWLLVLVALIWLLGRFVIKPRSGPRPGRPSAAPVRRSANSDMQTLLTVTLHNKAEVERLIQYEIKRTPGISRDEAISRACERWRSDNR